MTDHFISRNKCFLCLFPNLPETATELISTPSLQRNDQKWNEYISQTRTDIIAATTVSICVPCTVQTEQNAVPNAPTY
jgi:hypothetical protein